MKELLFNAREELKRADHLLYVSLKYTRTVDVIKNIVERLINAFDFSMDELIGSAVEQKQTTENPKTPGAKYNLLRQLHPDKVELLRSLDFYMLLRKISRAQYKKINEFRRHVTMIATIDNKIVNIDIDEITVYFEKTCDFVDYVQSLTEPGEGNG